MTVPSIWSVIPLFGIFLILIAAFVNASRIEDQKLLDLVLWQLIGRKSWFLAFILAGFWQIAGIKAELVFSIWWGKKKRIHWLLDKWQISSGLLKLTLQIWLWESALNYSAYELTLKIASHTYLMMNFCQLTLLTHVYPEAYQILGNHPCCLLIVCFGTLVAHCFNILYFAWSQSPFWTCFKA